jgi:hypothetical protein
MQLHKERTEKDFYLQKLSDIDTYINKVKE